MDASGIQEISTTDLTAGKKVVILAVPGAFTPTCSKDHVPGFIKVANDLKSKGIDTIACVSVNDPFVMGAWGKELGAGSNVMLLSDGNGTFTRAMGLELDGSEFGLGMRSQRYAMVVENGVITKLQVEPDKTGLSCSSADSMLALL
eukprot:GHRR01014096.1.p1 GENE.GHRR01014096.1~~GHRR01014096.1.p1  ORF type:complete len:146 (+),score=49.20 GHRR01014096.1:120-557(+)